jgi:hypothetical protein
MPELEPSLINAARRGEVPIHLCDLLNPEDAMVANLTEEVPFWLVEELANDGIGISRINSEWFLGPLDE